MRTLGLLLIALAIASPAVTAQETDASQGALIEAAEVSGISLDRLRTGLREDIRALSGTTLDRGKLDALATRIEEEQPEAVVAVRAIARPNGDARDAAERDCIIQALEQTSWNVSGAARLLGVERTSLHKRIRALGLSRR